MAAWVATHRVLQRPFRLLQLALDTGESQNSWVVTASPSSGGVQSQLADPGNYPRGDAAWRPGQLRTGIAAKLAMLQLSTPTEETQNQPGGLGSHA